MSSFTADRLSDNVDSPVAEQSYYQEFNGYEANRSVAGAHAMGIFASDMTMTGTAVSPAQTPESIGLDENQEDQNNDIESDGGDDGDAVPLELPQLPKLPLLEALMTVPFHLIRGAEIPRLEIHSGLIQHLPNFYYRTCQSGGVITLPPHLSNAPNAVDAFVEYLYRGVYPTLENINHEAGLMALAKWAGCDVLVGMVENRMKNLLTDSTVIKTRGNEVVDALLTLKAADMQEVSLDLALRLVKHLLQFRNNFPDDLRRLMEGFPDVAFLLCNAALRAYEEESRSRRQRKHRMNQQRVNALRERTIGSF